MGSLRTRAGGGLWPAELSDGSAESAFNFCMKLRTWNEAEHGTQAFPHRAYFREMTAEWRTCRALGRPLIIEKSRRLVTSWWLRGLELYDLGLQRSNGLITHLTNEDASQHVWRIWFCYEDLRRRNPAWNLGEPKTYGALADQRLDSLILPNGSKVEKHYEQPGGLQGSGYSWVTMEELSMYRYASAMFDQANKVVQASAKARNGLVCVVTNAALNEDWQRVKSGASVSPY